MRTKYANLTPEELRRELEHQIESGSVDMELCKEVVMRLP